MADEQWAGVVAKILAKGNYRGIANLLNASVPEVKEGAVVLHIPGGFFENLMPREAMAAAAKECYNVETVTFVVEKSIARALADQARAAPVAEPAAPVERPAPPAQPPYPAQEHVHGSKPIYKTKHFSLTDHLADRYHPRKSAYVVTPANAMAYKNLDALAGKFPVCPDAQPLMISAGVGMGKTHLLQLFAWSIADTIEQSRELLEKNDIAAAKKLLKLEENEPELAVRQLLRQAANSRVRYVSCEEFVDEHILSTNRDAWKGKEKEGEEYKRERDEWYRGIDYLFIDDIHAFAKGEKESTLEYAYKIADRFYRAGDLLVTATDTPPQLLIERAKKDNIKDALNRLFSRMYSGGIIAIEPPKQAELAEVLNKHLQLLEPGVRAIEPEELKKGSFYSTARTYRDAQSVAQTAYKYKLEGLSIETAVKKGIDALKTQKAASGDLF